LKARLSEKLEEEWSPGSGKTRKFGVFMSSTVGKRRCKEGRQTGSSGA